jgi:hypothetical protein
MVPQRSAGAAPVNLTFHETDGGWSRVSATLPRPVRNVFDAANGGDQEAFIRCFAPHGVVDDWGREFEGPDEIRGWSEGEFIGVGVTLEVEEVEFEGPRTIVAASVGGNGFNGPSHFIFETTGALVTRMTIRQ